MASHNVPRATQPRTEEQRLRDLERIQKYRDLEQSIRQRAAESLFDDQTFNLSSQLLRLNPEYYTVWNIRRRCLNCSVFVSETHADKYEAVSMTADSETKPNDVQQNDETTIRSELSFTVPLLMAFPKCYWIWKYRLWLLQQAIERLHVAAARAVWDEELALVGKMLHKDRRNFHAWNYRRHVVKWLESADLLGKSMTEAEFDYTTKMIHTDLSNFSAWHNRSQLIPRLLDERQADEGTRRAFLDQELKMVHEALNVGPDDQSLWYYHQYLVYAVIHATTGEGSIVSNFSADDRQQYLNQEIDFLQDLLEDYDDVKWIYEALVEYALAADSTTGHGQPAVRKGALAIWIQKLKGLDDQRKGRWNDLEKLTGTI